MMTRKCYTHLLILAAVVIGGMATSTYAHPGHSALRETLTVEAPGVIETKHREASIGAGSEVTKLVSEGLERKASSSQETTAEPSSLPEGNNEPEAAMQYNKEDEGSRCLRGAPCTCTSSGHGVTNCYAGRGDCYNHEGILCIWN